MSTIITPNASGVNASAAAEGKQSDNIDYQSAMKNHSLMGTAMVTMSNVMLLFTELANSKFAQMTEKMSVSRDAQEMANRVDRVLAGLAKPDDKGELPADVIEYMRANNILVDGKQTIDEYLGAQNPDAAKVAEYIKRMTDLIAQAGSQGMKTGSYQDILNYMSANGITVDGKEANWFVWESVGQKSHQYVTPENMAKVLGALQGTSNLTKDSLTAIKASLESASGRASDFVQQSQLKLQQLMQNFNTAVTMANSVQSMNAESTKSIAQSIR
ncbi:hypothetical protein QRZ34_28595 [Klebsiella michiganensis]|uniref:hypothetical protein n=1 Tax=Klebsiella michiganensis TaxID=1134687 RepID=UPI00256FF9A7|nr:hypothetical protein [Klebsiella michiganensis]MDL4454952.1 hypothetical protein [Klebsiella michiganensis]